MLKRSIYILPILQNTVQIIKKKKKKCQNMMVGFIFWIIFTHLEQKTNLNWIKKAYENKDYCGIVIPFEDTKILSFNQYQKSDKTQSIIYLYLESLI